MKRLTLLALSCLAATSTYADNYRFTYQLVSDNLPANWQAIDSQYGPWVDDGVPYGCSNWSPSVSSQGKGLAFVQTATDCSQSQTRTVQDYEQNNINNEIRKVRAEYTQGRVITVSEDRDAVGILENWAAYQPSYTPWMDTNALYGCSTWTPNPSSYTSSANFTQSSFCRTDQERLRQEREIEMFTDEVRDAGDPITERQTLESQSANRSYSVVLGNWNAVGAPYNCTDWSPATNTVGKGIDFSQNATDCKLNQSRVRTESYVDHRSGSIVPVAMPNESRTISNQANVRSAVGTLENWRSTDPTYTAWVNSGVVSGCSNWSPDPTTVAIGTTFTQTATDCIQPQVRSRQDRELESYTQEIRNSGSPVTETQSIAASSARSATGTKETWVATTPTYTAWVNSGAVTSCSNWSPAPETVTVNSTFTQTATDCKQVQTRSRQDRQQETTTKAIRNNGAPVTETQTVTTSSTRSATGTKETWVATTPTYTAWVNSGAVAGCSNWSPDPSTVNAGTSFTQTATNCTQAQTRNKQNREQESTTKAIRNVGSPVVETQNIAASSTRTATGTKATQTCAYAPKTTYVSSYGTVKSYMFYWGGNYVGGGESTSLVSGGYTYTVSTHMAIDNSSPYIQEHMYQICRK